MNCISWNIFLRLFRVVQIIGCNISFKFNLLNTCSILPWSLLHKSPVQHRVQSLSFLSHLGLQSFVFLHFFSMSAPFRLILVSQDCKKYGRKHKIESWYFSWSESFHSQFSCRHFIYLFVLFTCFGLRAIAILFPFAIVASHHWKIKTLCQSWPVRQPYKALPQKSF